MPATAGIARAKRVAAAARSRLFFIFPGIPPAGQRGASYARLAFPDRWEKGHAGRKDSAFSLSRRGDCGAPTPGRPHMQRCRRKGRISPAHISEKGQNGAMPPRLRQSENGFVNGPTVGSVGSVGSVVSVVSADSRNRPSQG